MKKYVLNRIFQAFIVIIGVSLLTFIMVNVAPGDAASIMTEKVSDPAIIARINAQLGLDKPLHTQYFLFLKNAAMGDFGTSFFRFKPVMDLIIESFKVTGTLAVLVVFFSMIVGGLLGVLASYYHNSWIDRLIMGTSTLGMALPTFLFAIILQWIFGLNLKVLPLSGLKTWQGYILPTLTLGMIYSAEIARLTRTNMLGVLDEDYIRTARAKGVSEKSILLKHGLKNASIPLFTYLGTSLKGILGGSVLTETVFGLNGVGRLLVDSILKRDTPVIQGVTIYIAVMFIVINLLIDLLYGWIDPRIRLASEEG